VSLRKRLYRLSWDVGVPIHIHLYRLTGGRVGGRIRKAKILLLDHVGRKTRTKRTSPLLYIEDGDDLAIVASKGGHPRHPAWYINLRANPQTTVQVGSDRRSVVARTATAQERERLWPKLTAVWPDYDAYQRRTDREIPVIILSRASGP
jgi:deazaflavin-dependent oxidoreductase (nitroreductase family)